MRMQHQMLQNVHCKATEEFVTIRATMSGNKKLSEQLNKELGQWLKEQRRLSGLTQEKVASSIPIDRVHLARIEKGDSGTKRDTLISIVETINRKSTTGHKVDVDEAIDRFYGRWNENDSNNIDDAEIVELETLYRKGRKLTSVRMDAFRRLIAMADREIDRLLEEEKAAEKQANKTQANGK